MLCYNDTAVSFSALQDAMIKDTLEKAREPDLNLKAFLEDAYIHPIFKGGEFEKLILDEESHPIVATKRNSRMGSKRVSSESSTQLLSTWWILRLQIILYSPLYHNIPLDLDSLYKISNVNIRSSEYSKNVQFLKQY